MLIFICRYLILFLILLNLNLEADTINAEDIAYKLKLSAGSKAIVQWERVFKSERKMKRYKIDKLTPQQQDALKEYLVNHAIDSDQPTVAGG